MLLDYVFTTELPMITEIFHGDNFTNLDY